MKASSPDIINVLLENGADVRIVVGQRIKRKAIDYMLDKNDDLVYSLVKATAIHKEFQDLKEMCDRVMTKKIVLRDKLKQVIEESPIDRALIAKLDLDNKLDHTQTSKPHIGSLKLPPPPRDQHNKLSSKEALKLKKTTAIEIKL